MKLAIKHCQLWQIRNTFILPKELIIRGLMGWVKYPLLLLFVDIQMRKSHKKNYLKFNYCNDWIHWNKSYVLVDDRSIFPL